MLWECVMPAFALLPSRSGAPAQCVSNPRLQIVERTQPTECSRPTHELCRIIMPFELRKPEIRQFELATN